MSGGGSCLEIEESFIIMENNIFYGVRMDCIEAWMFHQEKEKSTTS